MGVAPVYSQYSDKVLRQASAWQIASVWNVSQTVLNNHCRHACLGIAWTDQPSWWILQKASANFIYGSATFLCWVQWWVKCAGCSLMECGSKYAYHILHVHIMITIIIHRGGGTGCAGFHWLVFTVAGHLLLLAVLICMNFVTARTTRWLMRYCKTYSPYWFPCISQLAIGKHSEEWGCTQPWSCCSNNIHLSPCYTALGSSAAAALWKLRLEGRGSQQAQE